MKSLRWCLSNLGRRRVIRRFPGSFPVKFAHEGLPYFENHAGGLQVPRRTGPEGLIHLSLVDPTFFDGLPTQRTRKQQLVIANLGMVAKGVVCSRQE